MRHPTPDVWPVVRCVGGVESLACAGMTKAGHPLGSRDADSGVDRCRRAVACPRRRSGATPGCAQAESLILTPRSAGRSAPPSGRPAPLNRDSSAFQARTRTNSTGSSARSASSLSASRPGSTASRITARSRAKPSRPMLASQVASRAPLSSITFVTLTSGSSARHQEVARDRWSASSSCRASHEPIDASPADPSSSTPETAAFRNSVNRPSIALGVNTRTIFPVADTPERDDDRTQTAPHMRATRFTTDHPQCRFSDDLSSGTCFRLARRQEAVDHHFSLFCRFSGTAAACGVPASDGFG